MESEVAIITGAAKNEAALAVANDNKDYRILAIEFCKCDVISENGDIVERSEVELAKASVVGSLADIDHDFNKNVGSVIEPLDCTQEKPTTKVKISAIKYPTEIRQIESKVNSKYGLPISFETSFKHAHCTECGEDMGENSPYDKFYAHVRDSHPGKKVGEIGRKLKKLTFQGVGILLNLNPGFPGVKALALASKQNLEERSDIMADDIKKEDKNKEHEAVLAMSALKTEIDNHVKTIKGLEDTIVAKDKEIQEIVKRHDTVKSEFDTYKAGVEQDKRISGHFESAAKQGISFDDEQKKSLTERFKRWTAEDTEAYLADIAKTQKELKEAQEKINASNGDGNDKDKQVQPPQGKVPEPAKASVVPRPFELGDDKTKPPHDYKPKALDEKFVIIPRID